MYKTILHPTDLKEENFHITEKAKAISDQFKATLYLLHVIELPTSIQIAQSLGFTELRNPVKDDAVTVMEMLGGAISVPKKNQFIEIGSVTQHILQKAKELNSESIIIGSHVTENFPLFLEVLPARPFIMPLAM